jgi:hypothetical protein
MENGEEAVTPTFRTPKRNSGGRKYWCGPHALAVITGVDYMTAYRQCLATTGKRVVAGLLNAELAAIARDMGLAVRWLKPPMNERQCYPTLARFLDLPTIRQDRLGRMYLVQMTDHFIVVDTHTWTYCDNQKPEGWQPARTGKHARKYVQRYAEIVPAEAAWLIPPRSKALPETWLIQVQPSLFEAEAR